jgi:3-oxoadipate enol-lactonase
MNDAGSAVERIVELPGRGRTVVWLPGGAGPGAGARGHPDRRAQLVGGVSGAGLALSGTGLRSARGWPGLGCAGGYRLEQCADDIAGLAAVLGIDRLVVVGYSMGGLIAQLCWRRHPQLTAGLVLCATARSIAGVPWARWVRLMTLALLMSAAAAGAMSGMDGLRADVIGAHLLGQDGDRATRAWALGQMRRTPLLTALSAVSAIYAFSSHNWIGEVDVPTAVIITRHDRVVPVARQRRLAARCPQPAATTLTVITACSSPPRAASPPHCSPRAKRSVPRTPR